MKKIDLTLSAEDVKTIVRLLDEETDRLFKEGDEKWKKIGMIKSAIMISVYEHTVEERQ